MSLSPAEGANSAPLYPLADLRSHFEAGKRSKRQKKERKEMDERGEPPTSK